jgi:hypothetical protein
MGSLLIKLERRNVEEGFQSTIGLSLKILLERWKKEIRKVFGRILR